MLKRKKDLIACLMLTLANLIVYGQVYQFQFISFDDKSYIYDNPAVKSGLTADTFQWALTAFAMGHWHPLTWLSLMLDNELHGLSAGGYHVTNLLLHIINTLLLFLVLKYLTGTYWRSLLIAALFAFHPLHVETVAWVADRKDLLSTLFGFLTIWAYAAYVKQNAGPPRYLLILLFYSLSLMSKSMLITLPFLLLLLDYWPLNRYQSALDSSTPTIEVRRTAIKLIIEKWPLFLMVAIALFLAVKAQQPADAPVTAQELEYIREFKRPGIVRRLIQICHAYPTYLLKTFWPTRLGVYYPFIYQELIPTLIGAGTLLISVTLMTIMQLRQRPYLAIGWLWYLGTLFPVSWLLLADHYTYFTLIGIFILLVWSGSELVERFKQLRVAFIAATSILLVVLAVVSWYQVQHWRDNKTIYQHTLNVTNDNLVVHYNIGLVYFDEQQFDEAAKHFTEVINLQPNYVEAYYGLGNIYYHRGNLEESAKQYQQALQIDPNLPEAHYALGRILAKYNQRVDALNHFETALKLKPDYSEAHNGMGLILFSLSELDKAVEHFKKAIQLKPDFSEACYNLGNVFLKQKKYDEARRAYNAAIYLKKDFAEAFNNLGAINLEQQRFDDAVQNYREATRLRPTMAEFHFNLARALLKLNQLGEAQKSFTEAVRLKPELKQEQEKLMALESQPKSETSE